MNSINVNGRTLQYKVEESTGEDFSTTKTIFYEGTETYTYRRYLFFGKKQTLTIPKEVFTIYANADSPRLSKEWWKIVIEKEIELLNRQEQIKKGELL